MSVKYFYLAAVAAILGCGPAAVTSGTLPPGAVPRAANHLTSDEIVASHADATNAYDAIARLRPNWLVSHGVTTGQAGGGGTEYATVFVDGQAFGNLDMLRSIPAYHVSGIHYYNITEAGAKFGLRAGSSGVIEVMTNVPSRS
jgi:hypothetical protein